MTNICSAHEVSTTSSIDAYEFDRVSQHIYVIHGTQELPNPQTRGFMNNPAAIISDKGVIVVDPGSSTEIAQQLIQKIRKISEKPIVAVFNTHVHGDHWLGNYGIKAHYPEVQIYAHTRMIERVESGEGSQWIDRFMLLTNKAVEGTQVAIPDITVSGGETIIIAGLTFKFHHTGHAHTDSDLMIELVEDKSLFFGDVVAQNRVPNSDVPQDANFRGTIKAIDAMLQLPIQLFIPGHGQSGGREVPQASLDFLTLLYSSVSTYYEQGLLDYEMKPKVVHDLDDYKSWNNFKEIGRVIHYLYQEIEQSDF